MEKEIERIAKHWYTEQRGRVLGNTRDWDSLSQDEKWNIIGAAEDTLA